MSVDTELIVQLNYMEDTAQSIHGIGVGLPYVSLHGINADTPNSEFKTAEGFFMYQTGIEYLLDSVGIQAPSAAPLQGLGLPPVCIFDISEDSVQALSGDFEPVVQLDYMEDIAQPLYGIDGALPHVSLQGLNEARINFVDATGRVAEITPENIQMNYTKYSTLPLHDIGIGSSISIQQLNVYEAAVMSQSIVNPMPVSGVISKAEYTAENSDSYIQKNVFKTIEDFFIYLTNIEYLFDSIGIQAPPVTSLQKLSLQSPAYTFDNSDGIAQSLPGNYKKLEKILFPQNRVEISQVRVGEMEEYAHILPIKFASLHSNRLDKPIQGLDIQNDYNSISVVKVLPLENVIYGLNTQQEPDNELEDIVTGQYLTISSFLRDNFDEELVLPAVKVNQYLDVEEAEKVSIYSPILPGIRMTDEMPVSPFVAVNSESPVIQQVEQLPELVLYGLTSIDDDGEQAQIADTVNMGYSQMERDDSWKLKLKHGEYDSLSHLLYEIDEDLEISAAPTGAFTYIQPMTVDDDADEAIFQPRTVTSLPDIEQLSLNSWAVSINAVVATGSKSIDAFNKTNDISNAIKGRTLNNYVAQYENGVDGLADDIARTLTASEMEMEDTEIYVQGLEGAVAGNIKEEYLSLKNEKDIQSSSKDNEEALKVDVDYEYELNGDIRVHGYVPEILSKKKDEYKDITVHVYDSGGKKNTYTSSVNINADIEGVELQRYIKDAVEGITLYTYVPDKVPATNTRNEEESLITNISQQAEADIKISITKRLELWLKWLFEMSMKNFGGGSDEEFVNTVRRLKQMVMEEPDFLDVTGKSIRRFVEDVSQALQSYGVDAQLAEAYTDLAAQLEVSQK